MDQSESFITHLEALRTVLIKCLTALAVGLVPMYFVAPYAIDALIRIMLRESNLALNYFAPLEVFILQLKMALLLDFLLCLPYLAKQIWSFLLPALYEHEQRLFKKTVFISAALFICGAAFCLFFILPLLIRFGINFATPEIVPLWGITNIINLALSLSVIFGIMFQFPIITFVLIKYQIIPYNRIKQKRPYIFIAILIISGLLTPPDVVSQLMLTIPTYLLFEAGLLAARKR